MLDKAIKNNKLAITFNKLTSTPKYFISYQYELCIIMLDHDKNQ